VPLRRADQDPETLQHGQRGCRQRRLLHFLLRFRHLNLVETIFVQSFIVKKTSQRAAAAMVAVSFTLRMCNIAKKQTFPRPAHPEPRER
jgi:hypothetical protein